MAVPLHQKTCTHRPQAKILEFLVAILAGLPHLEDISRDGRPLDQDQPVAVAWQQAGWADYSGVGRTLQALTQTEAEAIVRVLHEISRPIIDEQVTQALVGQGRLIYDGDLTGRPVSNTSTTYPEAAFGHMDDEVRLGYQAAVVSMGSPTYGRHWLAVKPHPGNLVSCLLAEELVLAAEAATGVRPWRRTELLRQRWQALGEQCCQGEARLAQRRADLAAAQAELQVRTKRWQAAQTTLAALVADYQDQQRPERPHSQLAHARQQTETRQRQQARQTQVVAQLTKQVERHQAALTLVQAQEAGLRERLQRFEHENATNPAPITAVFRLDAGFGTGANIALLIEMGYEVYTRPQNHRPGTACWSGLMKPPPGSGWARMPTWWPGQRRPCRAARTRSIWRCNASTPARPCGMAPSCTSVATPSPPTCRPGSPFTMAARRLKRASKKARVSSRCIISRCVRRQRSGCKNSSPLLPPTSSAGRRTWLSTQCYQEPEQWLDPVAASIKTLVQVATHTPADVAWLPDGCLLRFTDASLYAGRTIQTGGWAFQLSLPLFQSCSFEPFSTNQALIAQPLR